MATVPTPAPAPTHPIAAQNIAAISDLAKQITDPARERPIVVLTPRHGHDTPYFPASWVVEVVEHHADVVAINHGRESGLATELDRLLPVGLGALNGAARIYWPFKRVGRSHLAHPLVLADRAITAGPDKQRQLEDRWTAGPDVPPPPASASVSPVAPVAPRPPVPARPRPVRPATPVAKSEPPTPPVSAPPAIPTIPALEDDLRLDVTRAWLELLPETADRNRFGLQTYRVAHELAAQLDDQREIRRVVAVAIAQVASGHVWTQPTPIPERVEEDGTPVLRRHDHAVAWRHQLAGTELCLFYWQPAAGPIVLAFIAEATETVLPNVEKRPRTTPRAPTPPATPAPPVGPTPGPRPRPKRAAPRPAAAPPPPDPTPIAEAQAPAPRKRRDNTPLGIDDQMIVNALKRSGKPTSISVLRELLEVPEAVGRERVRAVLGDAADRGVIGRSGVRGGVRYCLT